MNKQVTVEHSLPLEPENLEEQEGAFIEKLRGVVREVRSNNSYLEGYSLTDIGFIPEDGKIYLRLYFTHDCE